MTTVTLPPLLRWQLERLVGTIYGETFDEVVIFVLQQWMLDHSASAKYWVDLRAEYDRHTRTL